MEGRWRVLQQRLARPGPACAEDFDPELPEYLPDARVLVVGAGGLGCEMLKNLALSGVREIDVIDMDTIETSNLNRQFLFRSGDEGRFKAEAAASFIMRRVPGCTVNAHCCAIQEKSDEFYRQFHVVVTGLDSVPARSWMNAKLVELAKVDASGELDMATVIPMVDGGTSGFLGQVKVIIPRKTACLECMVDLFEQQGGVNMCTLKSKPRLPEHCVMYVYMVMWDSDSPLGDLDNDNPEHIEWIRQRSIERCREFNIPEDSLDYQKVQGVVKNIIPAIAATNAVIAAACTNEAIKLLTLFSRTINDFSLMVPLDSCVTSVQTLDRLSSCRVCGRGSELPMEVDSTVVVEDFLQAVREDVRFHIGQKGKILQVANESSNIFDASSSVLKRATAGNLEKPLSDFLQHGDVVTVLAMVEGFQHVVDLRVQFL